MFPSLALRSSRSLLRTTTTKTAALKALAPAAISSSRCFATESAAGQGPAAAPKKGGWGPWLVVGGVAAAAGGYYYTRGFASSAQTPAELKKALNKDEFVSFKLLEAIPLTHNTKRFRFELPAGYELGLPTASCVVTRFQDGVKQNGSPNYVIRPYTPVENVTNPGCGYFDLVVKRYPNGPMSNHIFNMKPGDSLDIKGPIPKWPYKANEFPHIGLIAGGTGLTPMLQLIDRVRADPNDKTKVTFLFANVTEEDIILKDYLDKLGKDSKGQISTYYILDKPPTGWTQGKGHVNEDLVKQFMPAPGKGKVFVCGPGGMMAAVSGSKAPDYTQGEIGGILKKLGYSADDVFKF
ncbi:NADH-cytochrome b5 reductase [Quaeritorhiza haematococci]|nr:NADH-cytochrome b5 reductase [Quaeritorhiza haematococci]